MQRGQPLPQRVDAGVRRRQATGDGVDPRRRVRLRLGRHPVVRRHPVRAATATSSSSRSTTASARSASCTSPTCSATSSRAPATPASSTRSPRSNGCATRSPRSAAIPTTSRSSASRRAADRSARCSACPSARGLFHKAIPQSGASSWWAPREARDRGRGRDRRQRSASSPATSTRCARCRWSGSSRRPPTLARHVAEQRRLAVPAGRRRHRAPASRRSTRSTTGNADGVHLLDRHQPPRDDAVQPDGPGPRGHRPTTASRAASDARGSATDADATRRGLPRRARRRERRSTSGPTSGPTRCSASRRSASPRRSARTARRGCTSSRGRRRCSAASLKSCHALEIPFVFDNLDRGAELFTGDGPERQGDRRRDARGVDRVRADRRPEPSRASPSGPPTTSIAARRCASTPRRKSSTTRWAPTARPGATSAADFPSSFEA